MTEQLQNQPQSAHSRSELGRVSGILAIIFAVIGIFVFGALFFLLTVVLSGIALWKKEYILGVIGSVLALVVLATSPTIWGALILMNYTNNYQKKIDNQAKAIIENTRSNNIPAISTASDPYGIGNSKPNPQVVSKPSNVGVEQFKILQNAFAAFPPNGIETFGTMSVKLISELGQDRKDAEAIWTMEKTLDNQLAAEMPSSEEGKYGKNSQIGNIKQMAILLRIKYLQHVLVLNSGKVDSTKFQYFVNTLDSIEDAIGKLDAGIIPETAILMRGGQDFHLEKAVIQDIGGGKLVFQGYNGN